MPDADDHVESKTSAIHGKGAFARHAIAEGTHIGDYDGTPTGDDGTYVLWVEGDDGDFHGIDGTGVLRWLNHSSSPNAEFDGPELYALRDIAEGEEITFHYGDEWEGVD